MLLETGVRALGMSYAAAREKLAVHRHEQASELRYHEDVAKGRKDAGDSSRRGDSASFRKPK